MKPLIDNYAMKEIYCPGFIMTKNACNYQMNCPCWEEGRMDKEKYHYGYTYQPIQETT